jgi:hypothetical protein
MEVPAKVGSVSSGGGPVPLERVERHARRRSLDQRIPDAGQRIVKRLKFQHKIIAFARIPGEDPCRIWYAVAPLGS